MNYHVTKTFQKLHFTFFLKYHVQYTQTMPTQGFTRQE